MRSPQFRLWLPAITLLLLASAAAGESPPVTDNVQKSDCPIRAKRFDRFAIEWPLDGSPAAGEVRSIRCVTRVEDSGRGRKGARVTLTAEVTDPAGGAVSLGSKSAKTGPSGVATIEFPVAGAAQGGSLTARVEGRYSTWKKATTIATDCTAPPPE